MWNCWVCTYACMLVWVHMCVYGCMHVCYVLQFGEPKEVPQCFVLHCCVTFVQWVLRPSLMQQTRHVCSGRLPFAMEPQTSVTDFHIIWQLLCYFMGCLLMGGTFIYDTWHRIAGITCTLHWRVQSQKTHLFGRKWLCDKKVQ